LIMKANAEQDGLIGISLDQTPTRHLMVLLCAFCTGLSYCDRVNLSVAVVEMSKDLDWDLNQRAIVLSSFFYGYVCSQIPSAYMARIYGGHVILGVAAFCWSLSTIAVPFLASVSFRAVVCGRIVLGLFEGCTFPVIYHLFSSCVPVEERSRSLGTIALGVFSGAIFSFIVSPILMHHYGWSTVFYFFGFLGFLWCGMWFAYFHVFVRDRPGPTANHPSTSNPCADTQQALKQLKHLVCHKVVLAIFWCHFCHNIGTFVMMSWLPTYFTDAYQLEGSALAFTCLPYISMGIAVSATSRVADSYIASGKYTLCYVRRASTLAGFAGAGTFMILIPLFASPIFGIFCMCVALALNGAGPGKYHCLFLYMG